MKGKGEPVKCAASDQAGLQSRKCTAQAQPDFVEDSSDDSGDEFMKAEQDKVAKLLLKLGKKASTVYDINISTGTCLRKEKLP